MSKKFTNTGIMFIPEAGITPYLRALSIIANGLKRQGWKIYFIRCTGEMFRCPMLCMHKLRPGATYREKKQICSICYKNTKKIEKKLGFEMISIKELVNPQTFKEINDLDFAKVESPDTICFDGFPVGQVAQYDFALEKKCIYTNNLDETSRSLIYAYIKNCALTITIGNELQARFKPNVFVSFNQYAQNDCIRYVASKNKVLNYNVTYPINLGFDGSLLYFSSERFLLFENKRAQRWDDFKDIPIPPKKVQSSFDDVLFRNYQQGSHIYTVGKEGNPYDLFKKLDLKADKKTVIAYTSSSDEILGGEIMLNVWNENPVRKYAFPDQIAWLKMLKSFVEERDDVQIVVRVHPREGVNKNYSFSSLHLQKLKKEFNESTDKFKVIWPEDKISSYNLLEFADAVLVAWSSMALEASRLGIRSLCYAQNMCYPDSNFIMIATNESDYRCKLIHLITTKPTFENLVSGIRFNHLRTFLPCIDLGESVSKNLFDNDWPIPTKSVIETLEQIINGDVGIVEINKRHWTQNLPQNAVALERDAILKGIRMFIDRTYIPLKIDKKIKVIQKVASKINRFLGHRLIVLKTSASDFKDYTFEYSEDFKKKDIYKEMSNKDKNLRFLIANETGQTWYIQKGRVIMRFSPLCKMLAVYHKDMNTSISK